MRRRDRGDARVRHPRRDHAGWVASTALALVYAVIGWWRYRNFWGEIDLIVHDQAVWLLADGRAPVVSTVGTTVFAEHLAPVLLAFVPLYWLVATPMWLLLAQAIALGSTIVPVRALARHEGVSPWVGTLLCAGSAPLLAGAAFDFHTATLAVPALAWALLAVRRDDRRLCLTAGAATVLCRVDLALLLIAFAIVARSRTRTLLLATAPPALLLGLAVQSQLGHAPTWDLHYGHLGTGPIDGVLHPWRVADAVISTDTLATAAIWLLPVGFLPLVAPRWLAALVLGGTPILVSAWPGTHQPWFHYGAVMAPLAMGGALAGLARLANRGPGRLLPTRTQALAVLAASVPVSLLLMSPISPSAPVQHRLWSFLELQDESFEAAVAAIGDADAVSATESVATHLAHRRHLWLWPRPFVAVSQETGEEEADPAAAARVDVVVVLDVDAEPARALGFTQATALPEGHAVVARRPFGGAA